jgi:ribosomal protein S18 acetylase RimI-like enzyme
MQIRRARTQDLAAVGEVTVAAYAEFAHEDTDDYVEHLRDAATRAREAELWVASAENSSDEIMGSVTVCLPGSPWREIARHGEGEFRMLSVAPQARGNGVGAALLDAVVARFRSAGASRVVMSTLPTMRAAHRIYERAGFVRMPERDWSPMANVHLIAYGLELDGPA